MPTRRVFYSFDYDKDVFRVQLIRNIGSLEAAEPVSANRWEEVKGGGDAAIQRWIDNNMVNRTCVIVLIGQHTASSKWVQYEIQKGWNNGMGVLGVHIHNVECARTGLCQKGPNPFNGFNINGFSFATIAKCFDPSSHNAFGQIRSNLEDWVEDAIRIRKLHGDNAMLKRNFTF